jgi:PKD repeat protein
MLAPVADFTYLISDFTVTFTDLSANSPDTWSWNFGDGVTSTEQNPEHEYATAGDYEVCLTVTNEGGSNTTCETIALQVGISSLNEIQFVIYPNPANELVTIEFKNTFLTTAIELFDITGRKMPVSVETLSTDKIQLDVTNISSGNYILKIQSNDMMVHSPLVIE